MVGTDGEALLDFDAVSIRRGGSELLTDVCWLVRPGERWAMLGPNGAGKTTLLQLASANLHPSTGTARVLGARLGAVDVFSLRPRIGLSSAALAQRIPAHERAIDVVVSASRSVIGRWREPYSDDELLRANDLLTRFGVGTLAGREYGTLSEGERKRVQIARALMTRPELLLLDEPAAGMDLGSREDLVDLLGTLVRDPEAPALVLVTHHIEELPDGLTHVMLIADGRVAASGPIDQVLTSTNLSKVFGVELDVEFRKGRWAARALTRSQARA